ncbi:MAG: hypothetical protein HQM12_15650 [SAR324 cluster bacterium]|nr:hypothetical protein [SAR324 cluster bacterium]
MNENTVPPTGKKARSPMKSARQSIPGKRRSWYDENKDKTLHSMINKKVTMEILEIFLKGQDRMSIQSVWEELKRLELRIKVEDLVSEDAFQDLFSSLVTDHEQQDQIIQNFITSQLYRESISELMFNNIRDMFLDENFFTQKVPIFGRLVKLGQNVASSTINRYPTAFKNIESEIKKFIKQNLHVIEGYTKTIMQRSMNQRNIQKMVSTLWDNLKDKEFVLSVETLKNVNLNYNIFFIRMAEGVIDAVIDRYGDNKISDLVRPKKADIPEVSENHGEATADQPSV